MVTRKQVAQLAGVSEGTVSNVVNGKSIVAKDKMERVLAAIEELHYVPDQTARSLVMRRSNHIGIAIYELTNPYHMEIAKCLEECASRSGFIVSVFMLDNNMKDKFKAMVERRLDGLVNFMTNRYPEEYIDMLAQRGTVLINFDSESGSVFSNDYRDATAQILQRLYDWGHRRIAYISTMDEIGFRADSRGKQWFESVQKLGFERAEVFYNHSFDAASDQTGRLLTQRMLETFRDATAVLCTNDLTAMGCMRNLADEGIRVPTDISVVGCDDIEIAKTLIPSLTTMSIDKYRQGEDIVAQIINQLDGGEKQHHVYHAVPVYRESIAPIRNR